MLERRRPFGTLAWLRSLNLNDWAAQKYLGGDTTAGRLNRPEDCACTCAEDVCHNKDKSNIRNGMEQSAN